MTFGQLSVLRALQRMPADHWSGTYHVAVVETPRPVQPEEVTSALRTLAGRHDSLRTHFSEDATVTVRDRVGDMAVDVVSVPDCDAEGAQTIGERHAVRRFDWDTELAWRAVAIHDGTKVSHIALVIDHIVADGPDRLVHELTALLGGDSAAGTRWLAEEPPQPADLAAEQRSDAWRHKRVAADRYWDRLLRESDPTVFPVPALTGTGRVTMTMHSSLTRGELARSAARLGVTAQSILLALTAAAVTVVRDADKVVLSIQSSNRFDAKWRDIVSSMNQAVPLPVTAAPGDTHFTDFVRKTQAANVRAYGNGAYDIDAAREKVRAVRGTELTFDNYFNFLTQELTEDGDTEPPRFVGSRPRRQYGPTFDLKVRRGPDMPVAVRTDPALLDEAGIRALLEWLAGEITRLARGESTTMSGVYGRLQGLLAR